MPARNVRNPVSQPRIPSQNVNNRLVVPTARRRGGEKVESRQDSSILAFRPRLGLLTTFHSPSPKVELAFAFEKLQVDQKPVDFSDAVCQHTEQFPRGHGFPVDPLNRADRSVAAKTSPKEAADSRRRQIRRSHGPQFRLRQSAVSPTLPAYSPQVTL